MKNEAGKGTDLHKLGEMIDDMEVAMLTTRTSDGSLVSRPLQTLKLDAGGELIFFTAADSHKVADLTENEHLNLAYANASDHRYVSVRGSARIDRDRSLIDELWSPMQKIFFPQGKDDPELVVLRVKVRDASYWESADNFLERALDFTRAITSKDPSDLGTHGELKG